MQIKDDPCRQTAYDMASYMSLDKAENRRYLRQLMAIADQKTNQNYFREQGLDEGIKIGMLRLQLQLIRGKLAQGKTLAETAADLLSSEEHLRPLYKAAKAHPDYSIEQLTELVSGEK